MNPYAATFQSPVLSASPVSGYDNSETPGGGGEDLMPDADEGDDGEEEVAWEGDDEGDSGEYYGYVDYGAAVGVGEYGGGQGYHHDEYDPAYHHQNGEVIVASHQQDGDGWAEHRRVYEERAAVTALEFDPLEELLWAGNSDGRLTSYVQPDMTKHSSVAAHNHGGSGRRGQPHGPDRSILGISLLDHGVLSISSSAVRLHSRGCLPRVTFAGAVEASGVGVIPPNSHFVQNLTCCVLNSPVAGLGMGGRVNSNSHVTVGMLGGTGDGQKRPPSLLQLDPVSGLRLLRVVEFPEEAGVTAMERGKVLAVGGEDGVIRLLDPRLRTSRVEHLLKAHTGAVQALAVTPTDGLKIVSVGMTSKSLYPYDTSVPTELFADPVVRVFDARMPNRPGPPLQFSMLGAPRLVRFLADESLALASSSGQFLLSKEPFTETPRLEFFHIADEHGTGEALTCMSVASSGDGIALGSAGGACIQMGHGEQDVRCNLTSRPIDGPERPAPAAEVYVDPCDEAAPPASKYVLRQTARSAHSTGPLCSSFASTPRAIRAVLRRPPPRRPAAELLEKAAWRDYLGVVPNPGYEPNSLLFGKGKAAYEVVDPRKRKDKDTPVFERRNRNDSLGGPVAALQKMGLEDVPRRYRRPVLSLGRRGFDGFDFGRYNTTKYAGLENSLGHTYVNSILQLLFFVSEVKEAALREQYNPVHYAPLSGRATSGLACELGFLFRQLERAKEMEPRYRSCQPTNFLRAFKEVPEVLALGLLEDPQNKRAIGLPRKTEALHRFLLSQLDKEAAKEPVIALPAPPATTPANAAVNSRNLKKDAKSKHKGKTEAAATAREKEKEAAVAAALASFLEDQQQQQQQPTSTVDRLYGYGTRTTNAFLHNKGVTHDVKNTRTLVTEMIPVDHPGHASPAMYFADALARSLCRETRARAWCGETSGYAPIKQKRCPSSLPEVMPIHCAAALESSDATRAAFKGKNSRGGPWLPQEIEISLVEGDDGEPTVVVGELADPAASWMQALEAAERRESDADTEDAADQNESASSTDQHGQKDNSPPGVKGSEEVPEQTTKEALRAIPQREGWYFTLPSGQPQQQPQERDSKEQPAAVVTPKGSKRVSAAITAARGVVRRRYELMAVVSRVVPKGNKKANRKAGTEAGAGAAGGVGSSGGSAGAETEVAVGEGHLVLHIRAPTILAPAAVTSIKGGGTPPRSSPPNNGKSRPKGGGGAGIVAGNKATPIKGTTASEGKGDDSTEDAGAASGSGAAAVDPRSVETTPRKGEATEEEGCDDDHDRPLSRGREEDEEDWLLFNDFLVERTVLEDARGFGPDWKEPCVIVYSRVPEKEAEEAGGPRAGAAVAAAAAAIAEQRRALLDRMSIPATVFEIPSLSKNRSNSQVVYLPPDRLPGKGDIVAIDAEFVSLTVEESRLRGDGSKVVTKQGRQSLARVSVVDGRAVGSSATAPVIMDDYVVQSEPVVDHLTRFSGITPGDLDPGTSSHHLHHLRTVYLRLRWLADAGCIFLGHGLNKDFRMFNLTLPPNQVIDTVNLWSLPGQRKISLRFLAHYLLGMNIQGETHDSIEDARIALALFNKYQAHLAAKTVSEALDALYKYGWEVSWKLDGSLTG